MKIQFQSGEVSVLCGVSASGCRSTLGGRGAHIIFHGQRKAAIKKCPFDPKEITHKTCGVEGWQEKMFHVREENV